MEHRDEHSCGGPNSQLRPLSCMLLQMIMVESHGHIRLLGSAWGPTFMLGFFRCRLDRMPLLIFVHGDPAVKRRTLSLRCVTAMACACLNSSCRVLVAQSRFHARPNAAHTVEQFWQKLSVPHLSLIHI